MDTLPWLCVALSIGFCFNMVLALPTKTSESQDAGDRDTGAPADGDRSYAELEWGGGGGGGVDGEEEEEWRSLYPQHIPAVPDLYVLDLPPGTGLNGTNCFIHNNIEIEGAEAQLLCLDEISSYRIE